MANENKFINIYYLDPVEGATGDAAYGAITTAIGAEQPLSSEGNQSKPLTVTINSSENKAVYRKCGIRTMPNFKTTGDVTIAFQSTRKIDPTNTSDSAPTTDLCWRIGNSIEDFAGIDQTTFLGDKINAARTLTINGQSEEIVATQNRLFYIMVLAASDEEPTVDRSVSIVTTATIAAVEAANNDNP